VVASVSVASRALGLGDAAAAERRLRAALRADPAMAEAAYNLGVLLAPD